MVPFLLPNFRKFLNWYLFLFCSKIFALFSNGTIFVSDFSHFAQMVPYFGFQIFSLYSNGTFFVAEFWNLPKMVPFFVAEFSHIPQLVPYLLQNFRTFPNGIIFSPHSAQIGSTVFKATFIGTFWHQKVKVGLGGYKKSAIGV